MALFPVESYASLAFIATSISLVLYFVLKVVQVGRRPSGLPPGPPTVPVLGNLHLMPTFKPYKKFEKWGHEYGPVYSLMLGSSPAIFIQSAEIVKDLLDKRGSIYSSRPDLYILSDIASRGLRQVGMKYGAMWRLIHRVNHQILNMKSARSYSPYQTLEIRQMLVDIANNPADSKLHIQRFSNSFTTQMVYGFRVPLWSDPKLQTVVSIFSEVCDMGASISAKLFDCYPILRRLPNFLFPVVRKAMALDVRGTSLYLERWHEGKGHIQKGSSATNPCFIGPLVDVQQAEDLPDELCAHISGSIVEASSSTTSDELLGFLMAMVTHPDVQKKAQAELDQVVGRQRLPVLEDMPNLPFIRGCVKETIRWMPTTSLLIPHAPLKDDTYQGYLIPEGTAIIVNVWALNNDPARWPRPRVFDPSRFAAEDRLEYEIASAAVGPGDAATTTHRHNYIFGAGRRLCQGIHIAERSLFLAMACLLWAFDMTTPDPSKIDTEDLRGGFAVIPAPFECNFKARDEKRAEVCRQEWETLQAEFLDSQTKQWKFVPDGISVLKNRYPAKS